MGECGLLSGGGIPFQLNHFAFAPLFGVCYVLFSWSTANIWDPKHGPFYMYFFLDTTLGYGTTIAIVLLLIILLACYGMFFLFYFYLVGHSTNLHDSDWRIILV